MSAKRARPFPFPWFRREDYDGIRGMLNDPERLPGTYEEWFKAANRGFADCHAQGMPLQRVIIDPDGFARFCARAEQKPEFQLCVAYAAARIGDDDATEA